MGRKTTYQYWETIEQKLEDTPWLLGNRYLVADAYLLVF